jgi:hypothetical protein
MAQGLPEKETGNVIQTCKQRLRRTAHGRNITAHHPRTLCNK